MNSFFSYIWRNSRSAQIRILLVVLVSFPFYYLSLDLPKYIVTDALQGRAFAGGTETAMLFHLTLVLPDWLGGARLVHFDGLRLDRISYLFALAGLFLLLVLVNGGFKYVINMRKGALGERLLQRLRFDLFSSLLTLTPEAARHVRPSEAATIIKDEVEPIGGFVGDAFVQPVFLGGQAATALTFILIQNFSLGLIAAFVVFLQAVIIPRLRREQIRLGKQRQLASRALAGKIGEVVESLGEIANHGTHARERQQVAGRLEVLFGIRYRLYERKFAVKMLNNLLAQATPFLFYTVGGYYALAGSLDLGQLVAVIAAYRELPPPIKELIDWDQQRLDAEAKFQQVSEQFAIGVPQTGDRPALTVASAPAMIDSTEGRQIAITGLSVVGSAGDRLLDRVILALPLGKHIALVGKVGEGAATLAQVLGGRITAFSGSVTLAGQSMPLSEPERQGLAYVGPEAAILDGTLRDNIIYGLRRGDTAGETDGSTKSGELALAGCDSDAAFDARLVAVLMIVGLDELVFRLGLARPLETHAITEMRQRIPELRAHIRARLMDLGVADAVEPYDPARFIRNASIGENILFGWPTGETFIGERLSRHAFTRKVIDQCGLTEPLTQLGQRIAATMLEIFEGLPPDHILFEQFAFFSADSFPEYRELLGRSGMGGQNEADRVRLLGLAMLYVEPRHRLGLVDEALELRIMTARQMFRGQSTPDIAQAIAFYDPSDFCAAAPLRDNLLFGAVSHGETAAQDRIISAIHEALTEMGMVHHVYGLGLEQPAGHAGRFLFPGAKMALMLARSLIRRPQILILNDALAAFGQIEAARTLAHIQKDMTGRTLIVAGRMLGEAPGFDLRIAFNGGRNIVATNGISGDQVAQPDSPAADTDRTMESNDLKALRSITIFAGIDTPRLRLLAFTSMRTRFEAGETLFRQGEDSDAAYVIISGSADVLIDTGHGPVVISQVGENVIVGEMGIVTGEPRSATIMTTTELTALRLRKEVFLALMAEFPQMALSVTRLMVQRLQNNVTAISRGDDQCEVS
jgi:putative ABC transport system ATP-binding protein